MKIQISSRFRPFLAFLEDLLTPNFVFGISAGTSFVLLLLLGFTGLDFTFKDHQLHAHTFLWLVILATYFYRRLESSGLSNLRRFRNAFLYMLFVFEIHDVLWIISTLFLGIRFAEIPAFYPHIDYYNMSFCRFVTMIGIPILLLWKKIHFSKRSLAFLGFQVLTWIFTYLTGYFFPFIVYNVVDTLPYLSLDKR